MSPPNVLLITVDGLRYDRLSRSGYDRETTPTLDALADAGAFCENAMAAGTGTLMSFPGILTSSYPLMYGGYTELTDARETVASVFRDHGYATLGVNTNAQLHPTFGWDRGFDVYVDGSDVFVNKPVGTFAADSQDGNQSRVGAAVESVKTTVFRTLDNDGFVYRSLESAYRLVDDRSLPHPDATAVVDTVVDCWKELPDDRPTFLWVHFMETHIPYLPPPEYRERFLSESLSEGDIWRLNDLLHEQPDS